MFREKKEVPEDSGLTPDFDSMIKIVFWNSMGFFFFNFLIAYFTGIVMETSMIELGLTFSMLIIGGLFSNPIVGYLTDRVSKKKLILIGSIGRGISYFILYISCNLLSVDGFKFGMLFLGLSVGFFWTPFDVLVSEKSNAENRSYAFGKRQAAMGRGNFVGSIISFTIFASTNTFVPDLRFLVYSPLIIFAFANFYAGTIFFKNVDETLKYETSSSKEHIHHLDSDAEMYLESKTQIEIKRKNGFLRNSVSIGIIIGFFFLILARFFSMVNGTIAEPFMQNYIVKNIVDDSILVMLIYFPSGIISQIIAPKLGILSDKINNSIGIAMASITGALFTLLLINTTDPYLFSFYLVIDSAFAITGQLILMNIFSRISKTHRGKVFGMTSWIGRLGGIAGPIVGGYLSDSFGLQTPFIISIFIELTLIPLYLIAIFYLAPHMAEKVKKESKP